MALIEAAERERKMENRKTRTKREKGKERWEHREKDRGRKGRKRKRERFRAGAAAMVTGITLERNRTEPLWGKTQCVSAYTHTRTHKTHQTITFSFMFHQHCPIFGCRVLVEYENFFWDQQSVQRSSNDAPLAMDV